ncbi:MAG TPA: urease accessory protein UreD [Bacillales bacterium]|nr:urease accessory protein UreD [Bacillales bacterium]
MRTVSEWSGVISRIGDRNYLADSMRRFPMDVHELPEEEGALVIYLMSASPGLFNGDEEYISCRLTKGAHLHLTTPAANELHPSIYDGEESLQTQTFYLEKDSILEYLPEPMIPFRESNFNGMTSVYMSEGSQAIISEIVTAGRIGRNEIFQYKKYASTFEVYWEDQLEALDRLVLDPKTELTRKGIFGDYTHLGTLWVLSEKVSREHLRRLQTTVLADLKTVDVYGTASLLQKNGLIIRLLGRNAQSLQKVMTACWDDLRGQLFEMNPLVLRK